VSVRPSAIRRVLLCARLSIGTFPGCFYDGKRAQPRKLLSGTGTPAYEVQCLVPYFSYGIPTSWVGINDDDPPIFESQASYLKRHGLLAGEERRADFESEEVYSESCLSAMTQADCSMSFSNASRCADRSSAPRRDLDEAIAFAAEGKVRADISKAPLSNINAIFDRLKSGRVEGRMVLEFG